MSVSVDYNFKLKVTETPTLDLDGVDDPDIVRESSTTATLTGSTTIPVTKAANITANLSGGAATLDLTALDNGNLPNVDMSGLKVQLFKMTCPATNTGAVTAKDGATNGYNIFGSATGEVAVMPGGAVMFYGDDELDDVGAADLAIDLSSADTDATYTVEIVAG